MYARTDSTAGRLRGIKGVPIMQMYIFFRVLPNPQKNYPIFFLMNFILHTLSPREDSREAGSNHTVRGDVINGVTDVLRLDAALSARNLSDK